MSGPIDLRNDLYRELFFSERARREQIRSSIGFPTSAVAFSVYAFSGLAQSFDVERWDEPVALAIIALTLLAIVLMLFAVVLIVRVEWLFSYSDPPDLYELVRMERGLRERAASGTADSPQDMVPDQLKDALTGSFYIGYMRYFNENARSASYRARALRLVLAALMCLLLAFALLPLHLGKV